MWSKCSSTIARSWPWRRPIRRRAASSARCSRTSSELMWRPPIAWSRETPSVDSWSADERRSTPEGTGFAPSPILAARSLFSPRRVPVLVDWSVWRDEFPTFRTTTYLNTCSLAPLAVRVRVAHERFLDEWEALGASAWYEVWISALDALRAKVARVLGAKQEEIALAPSVSVALSAVASALDYAERPRVCLSNLALPTLAYQSGGKPGGKRAFLPSEDGIRVSR